MAVAEAEQPGDVKYVIAVMSGKGGVGKSLVSGLLAIALRREGYEVGVLDADITGPSIPRMFFPKRVPVRGSVDTITPPTSDCLGIKVMSINLLLPDEAQAVVWRGPLIGRTIEQFWGDVSWDVDYLVVDLPPGTSDAALTVMKSMPLSGVVLVTSPQNLAGMVVKKAAQMAELLEAPVLGLVENMSYFVCPDTQKRHYVFGPSHAEEMSRELDVPFLGRIPIDPEIADLCDTGRIEECRIDVFESIAAQIIERAPKAQARIATQPPG